MLHIFLNAMQQPRKSRELSMTKIREAIREAKDDGEQTCTIEGKISEDTKKRLKAQGIKVEVEFDEINLSW